MPQSEYTKITIEAARLEAEVAQLETTTKVLRAIASRGGTPTHYELLHLRVLSGTHAEWIEGLVAAMMDDLKKVTPMPRGAGARGSDGGGPYTRR